MTAHRSFVTSLRAPSMLRLIALTLAILAFGLPQAAKAQRSYQSPEGAVEALVNAVRSGERKSILAVLSLDAHESYLPAILWPMLPPASSSLRRMIRSIRSAGTAQTRPF